MKFGPEETTYTEEELCTVVALCNNNDPTKIENYKGDALDHLLAIRDGNISDRIINECPCETLALATINLQLVSNEIIRTYSVIVPSYGTEDSSKSSMTVSSLSGMLLCYGTAKTVLDNTRKIVDRISEATEGRYTDRVNIALSAVNNCLRLLIMAQSLLTSYRIRYGVSFDEEPEKEEAVEEKTGEDTTNEGNDSESSL